jgi:hypothetical protein
VGRRVQEAGDLTGARQFGRQGRDGIGPLGEPALDVDGDQGGDGPQRPGQGQGFGPGGAGGVGTSRARWYAGRLHTLPDVVLYSERGLSLAGPGVREVRCAAKDAAYRFRYDGLKLMLRSGDQYLFIPGNWTPATGTAFVLPRTSSLRLEFARPFTHPRTSHPTC